MVGIVAVGVAFLVVWVDAVIVQITGKVPFLMSLGVVDVVLNHVEVVVISAALEGASVECYVSGVDMLSD